MILVGLKKEEHIFVSLQVFCFCFFLLQVSVLSGSSVLPQTVRSGGGFVGTLTPQCFQIIGPVIRIQVEWTVDFFFLFVFIFLPLDYYVIDAVIIPGVLVVFGREEGIFLVISR